MKINNYLYPHPILGLSQDYKSTPNVEFIIDYNLEDSLFLFKYKVADLPKDFIILLDQKKLKVVCEVNCSGTIYRQVFTTFNSELNFKISDSEIKNEVDFQLMLLVMDEILRFQSIDFSEDLIGYTFDFEAGDIAGILNTTTVNVDLVGMTVSDFIKISENMINEYTIYELEKNFIEIKLPKDQLVVLQLVRNNPDFENILISTLIIPALIHAIHILKEENEDGYGNRAWFQALKEESSEYINKEYPEDPSEISLLVDTILKKPNERLFNDLYKLMKK